MATRVPCAGAVIADAGRRLLLIQRGHEPAAGLWSLPGGRIEPGESDEQAVRREVREECGLDVRCGPLLGAVDRPGPDGTVLQIRDYQASVTGGELQAGDDAADARWADQACFAALEAAGQLTPGLAEALRSWSALPWL